jgi:hypothetical protein
LSSRRFAESGARRAFPRKKGDRERRRHHDVFRFSFRTIDIEKNMNISHLTAITAASLLGVIPASAALNVVDPAYSATVYLTHANSDAVTSYDWTANGDAYYSTGTSSYTFGGLNRFNGTTISNVVPASSEFNGASVVAIGNNIYYNTSDSENQYIHKYGPVGGSPAASLISTTANYSLHTFSGSLFITGSTGFGPNHIYNSAIDGSGNLVSNPARDLGETGGASGPLAFDSAGNLYYAPGYGDSTIYRFTSAEVADALAGVPGSSLSATGHDWLDYTALYAGGASSMLVDANGVLIVSFTDFVAGSSLATFNVDGSGAYGGSTALILESDDRLGEIRLHDGALYVADGNSIYQVIPEPSSLLLSAFGLALLARRKR